MNLAIFLRQYEAKKDTTPGSSGSYYNPEDNIVDELKAQEHCRYSGKQDNFPTGLRTETFEWIEPSRGSHVHHFIKAYIYPNMPFFKRVIEIQTLPIGSLPVAPEIGKSLTNLLTEKGFELRQGSLFFSK